MKQQLTTDTVSRRIEATPEALYALISDVTRTPEYSPEVVKCTWIKGATGPAVGARFKAINHAGRVPDWPNRPIVTIADVGRTFAFERTEVGGGTIEWRYTRVYLVIAAGALGLLGIQVFLSPPVYVSIALAAAVALFVVWANREALEVEQMFPEVARVPGLSWLLLGQPARRGPREVRSVVPPTDPR